MISEKALYTARQTIADYLSGFQQATDEGNTIVQPEQLAVEHRDVDFVELRHTGWYCYLVEDSKRAARMVAYLKYEGMHLQGIGNLDGLPFILAQIKNEAAR
jgi:hypothetical protein